MSGLHRFEKALRGLLSSDGGPCSTCGGTDVQAGILVFASPEPPDECPECGREPILCLPDNNRGDRPGVVQ